MTDSQIDLPEISLVQQQISTIALDEDALIFFKQLIDQEEGEITLNNVGIFIATLSQQSGKAQQRRDAISASLKACHSNLLDLVKQAVYPFVTSDEAESLLGIVNALGALELVGIQPVTSDELLIRP